MPEFLYKERTNVARKFPITGDKNHRITHRTEAHCDLGDAVQRERVEIRTAFSENIQDHARYEAEEIHTYDKDRRESRFHVRIGRISRIFEHVNTSALVNGAPEDSYTCVKYYAAWNEKGQDPKYDTKR